MLEEEIVQELFTTILDVLASVKIAVRNFLSSSMKN